MTFTLPTQPQTAAGLDPDPLKARVFIAGLPKVGKTTLLSEWAPKTTLHLDLQHGTDLLPGSHYVSHIDTWDEFDQATRMIAAAFKAGTLPFKTVGIDTIDMAYKLADAYAASQHGQVAAGAVEYGKGTSKAEGYFRQAISRLLACRGLGVWFLGHAVMVEDDEAKRYVPTLDKRVRGYVIGEVEHQLIAEKSGKRTVLHTQATQRYEAGSRLPLPDPLDMNAKALYRAMQAGIAQLVGATPTEDNTTNGIKREPAPAATTTET